MNQFKKFESERDYFLNQLKHNEMFDELKTVCKLFATVMYVDTETPDFVFVDIGEEFTDAVNINEEYDIIDESDLEETTEETKLDEPISQNNDKLSEDTINRVLANSIPRKEAIFQSILKGQHDYIIFKELSDGVILNNHKFLHIGNNGLTEPITKYSKELFKIMSDVCAKKELLSTLGGAKPIINEANQQIICSWA
jgi:hypothetical protein